MLDVDKSTFVDFQKIRIQETQSELPRGCVPRSVQVILRSENVETIQVNTKCQSYKYCLKNNDLTAQGGSNLELL